MLSSNDVSFSEETKEVLKKIIKEPCFKEINDMVYICNLNADENSILQNIKDYIWTYMTNFNEKDFIDKTQVFIEFFSAYILQKAPRFNSPSTGLTFDIAYDLLPVSNGYHIDKTFHNVKRGSANGMYSFGVYLGTNHSIYLAKKSMNSRNLEISEKNRLQVDYNSIMAQSVFEYFNEPVAEYYLLHEPKNPFYIILTKNFLDYNQELIHFSELLDTNTTNNDISTNYNTHSNRIDLMAKNIELRYKHLLGDSKCQLLIDKLKLQYCKQQFMKLLIGPMDMNMGNTALLITSNPASYIPDIDISPAYDLDISFNVSEDLVSSYSIFEMKDSKNQPINIFSFIHDFKDIPGFRDFLENFIKKINQSTAEFIVNSTCQKTNFSFFKQNGSQYIEFLNNRFEKVLEAYREVFVEYKGDEEK